jgi:hypothetical protein
MGQPELAQNQRKKSQREQTLSRIECVPVQVNFSVAEANFANVRVANLTASIPNMEGSSNYRISTTVVYSLT